MNSKTRILAAAAGILLLVAVSWLLLPERAADEPPVTRSEIPRYRTGGLVVGVATEPAAPQVGENRLIVELATSDGEPVTGVTFDAHAEMPAMGAMPAMRAPVEIQESAPGRYVGSFSLQTRGEWPLTLGFETPDGHAARLLFDLAVGRKGLSIASGATPLAAPALRGAADDADVITIDSRRRQSIGVETGQAAQRQLTKSIRAVGRITPDERLLSQIALKFDAYIGDLKADYVGAPIEQGQVLFTVYSPELLAAQQEYLETLNRGTGDALLAAARQRLTLWDMSDGAIQALERRGTPQAYVPILAPRSGTLIERNIADGSAAPAGRTLLAIADLSRVWVDAEVFEGDLALVRQGMPAAISLPYLPDRQYEGTVDYVYPQLEGHSRTGRIRLSLDNPEGHLKPEMYAEVTLQADLGQRLVVPEEAIIFAGAERIAFIDLGGGRLKPVRVRIGQRAGGFIEITEGLSPGDSVVTSANFLIAAEARLKGALRQW